MRSSAPGSPSNDLPCPCSPGCTSRASRCASATSLRGCKSSAPTSRAWWTGSFGAALVRRITDPLDQRARLLELTAKGEAAIESYLQIVFGWFTDALTHWSPHDRQTLAQLLARFVDDLSAHVETQLNEPREGPDA
jgi:hypothetical protein